MEEDILRGLTQKQLEDLIDKRIENRVRTRMVSQNDIFPQTIKERHIDWEEFNATSSSLTSSFIRTVSALVKTSSGYSVSNELADDEEYEVSLQSYFSDYKNRLLGVWHANFYESSATLATMIPLGASITTTDYRWYLSPSEYGLTTLYTTVGVAYYGRTVADFWIINESGGAKTVLFKAQIRYLGNTV